jgi:oligopeptidase B
MQRAMRSLRFFLCSFALALSLTACAAPRPVPPVSGVEPSAALAPAATPVSNAPLAPKVEARPHLVRSPAGERNDEYYWLRDDSRTSPEMLAYVRAENAYKDAQLAPLAAAKQQLLQEIVARIPQEDESAPVLDHGYTYWTRFVRGGEYPVHLRRRAQPAGVGPAKEELLLDGNELARGHDFYRLSNYEVSSDGKRLAWAEDTVGRGQHVIRFRDLETGQLLADRITNADADLAWANDHQTVLYVEKDPETLLGSRVRSHRLGTDPHADPLVYEEKDHSFYLSVYKSRSQRFLYIHLHATDSSEQWVARADDAKLAFSVLVPRAPKHEYSAEDLGQRFVLRSNLAAPNFRIVEVPAARVADSSAWRELVPHPSAGFVEDFAVFRDQLAFTERVDGLLRLRVRRWKDGKIEQVELPEASYTVQLGENPEADSHNVRFKYSSLTTPPSVYDFDVERRTLSLRKQDSVVGGYDATRFATAYLRAPARDGTQIPVSIVYEKQRPEPKTGALYMTAYGSYGSSEDPEFSLARLSLLERGVTFAIAHVRGGQELGRAWYEQGRLLHKRNTFTDFIDATDFLVQQGFAAPGRVVARGGSAGGLLMGAVANMAPEKYRAIAAHVPFVDVVTTMLDESIPLTTNEFEEWGDPRKQDYYDYMLSYSPYDNVRAQAYPALYVTTGLWDSQVQYYEPLKWVARLRAHKTDTRPLILRVNMEAGHGGRSGRFVRQEQTAEEYAFLLDQLGVAVGAK